jgi:hypothetical protein
MSNLNDDARSVRSTALRIETAAGKTRKAIEWAAGAVQSGLKVVVAVPRHNLADELVKRFADLGVTAHAYRGYEADDPDQVESEYDGDEEDQVEDETEAPRIKMCRQRAAMRDAERAKLPVKSSVCKSSREIRGKRVEVRCVRADDCGMMRQASADPQVWIVPHAMLFQGKPTYISKPDVVIIDESFCGGAIPQSSIDVTLDAFSHHAAEAKVFCSDKPGLVDGGQTQKLRGHLNKLGQALKSQSEDGWLTRDTLECNGISLEMVTEALKQQWNCLEKPDIYPAMPPRQRKALSDSAARVNREVINLCGLWREIRNFLNSTHAQSGRMRLTQNKDKARVLERRSLKTVTGGWQTDCLILDATLPDRRILEAVLDHPVDIAADIAVHWSRSGHTRQILFAPVSASRLGIARQQDEGKPEKRVIAELLGFIALRAALAFPEYRADPKRVVAVVGQKKLIALLKASRKLPPNVETGNFGNLSGLDKWKDATGMIVIGRPLPGPEIVEGEASVITGAPALQLPRGESGASWYPKVGGAILHSDGTGAAVEMERHPDPIAEALRWQHCEAELIQALGRLRVVRRDALSPYFIDIISDVVLPITVDSVVTWEEARPGPCTKLLPHGILLQSVTDIAKGFPELAGTENAARLLADVSQLRGCLSTVMEIGSELRQLKYLLEGKGRKPALGIVFPNAPANLREELERRLGPMVRFEVSSPSRSPG